MIFKQLTEQLLSLSNLISKLEDFQYSNKIEHLGNASIGSHTRHIIEMLLCATQGYNNGIVDYVNRNRNLLLESDKNFALFTLQSLENEINMSDKYLKMVVEDANDTDLPVFTTYFREIIYNTEHTIHHLALIKVALIEMKLNNFIDVNFGMAYSTIKYKNKNQEKAEIFAV